MKRRIAYLYGSLRTSTRPDVADTGPRSQFLGVTRAFQKLGWEVELFVVADRIPRRWANLGSERGVRRGFLLGVIADLMLPIVGVVNARRAWRELGGRVDWVLERHNPFNSMGWKFKRHGVPWVLETHEPFFYEIGAKKNIVLQGLARWLEIKAYEECDVLVCVSETLKEIVVREVGIPPDKAVVIPTAVDSAVFDPDEYEPRRVFEGFVVGYVGGLEPRQGLRTLIEALGELRAEGMKSSLVVAGDGPARAELQALARRLGISEHVAFVGQVPWGEVPEYIAGFDVGYSGQVRMGGREMYHSPLKLYEYMAMAKPVVASSFEDARRAVRDDETGFLFRAGDKEDLKRALMRAYGSRDRLPRMGAKARKEVVAKHDWLARVRDVISAVEDRL